MGRSSEKVQIMCRCKPYCVTQTTIEEIPGKLFKTHKTTGAQRFPY